MEQYKLNALNPNTEVSIFVNKMRMVFIENHRLNTTSILTLRKMNLSTRQKLMG
jgi:hypothetical protein